MRCYYCGCVITDENRSEEHIIPNALGGRISSTNLLCDPHNNELGGNIDAELIAQLGHFAAIIDVERDRPKKNINVEVYDEKGEIVNVGPVLQLKPILTFPLKNVEGQKSIPVKNGTLEKAAKDKKKELEKAFGKKLDHESGEEIVKKTFYFTNPLRACLNFEKGGSVRKLWVNQNLKVYANSVQKTDRPAVGNYERMPTHPTKA